MDLDEALSRPGFLRDHFPAVAAACEQFVACQWESMLVTCQCADTAGSVARAAVRHLCAPASAGGGGLSPLHPEGGELRAGASGLLGALSEACAMPPALGGERRVGLFLAADRVERRRDEPPYGSKCASSPAATPARRRSAGARSGVRRSGGQGKT